jgi:putative NADH-flavin reductase
MKIAVIGATGRVGRALVAEALARGHEVIAVTRNADKAERKPGVSYVMADVRNADEAARAVKGADVVISAYGAGHGHPTVREDYTRATNAIIAGLKKAGIRRVLFVGGAGSLVENGARLIDHASFPEAWKPGAQGTADALDIVRKEKELEWSYFSPAMQLMDEGKSGGKFSLGLDAPVRNPKGEHKVTIGDYAHAALDEIEHPKHLRRRFTIGSTV